MKFVGLRAKMCSFITESDRKEHMKAKGVCKDAMQSMHHKDYVNCLTLGTSNTVRMQSIRYSCWLMEMFKKGLICNDVKRWICPDGIHTEPYCYNPSDEKDGVEKKRKRRMAMRTKTCR